MTFKKKSASWIASFPMRLLAFLLDVIPITIIVFIIAYQIPSFKDAFDHYRENPNDLEIREEFLKHRNIVRYISGIIYMVYAILMNISPLMGTLGKAVLRIKVVSSKGIRLTLGNSIKRECVKILSIIPAFIGCLASLFNVNRQSWHDKAAKSFVINPNLLNEAINVEQSGVANR